MTQQPSVQQLVLLVEDESILLMANEETLRAEGFDVVACVNGGQEVAELERDATRFCALVTDVQLGSDPNGWEVGRRARELAPAIPVIYVTGDSAAAWSANGVPESILIAKPFVPAQLVTALATLLNQPNLDQPGPSGA
ncbi:response regulator [Phyllobacterium sp. SYP-B3895]|uniref:response regulator n=1 Tax=Phyllobacterium sp. SYP-B3895 TaxID=2663240 RepID=UPI001299E749|nr:response regulator [Phyllobacterium sp. SYP-B3895]MRG55294.1 response regulator [Phyllobacterium sp. SYP-B3895]